jgi:hypothetical protein
MQGGLSKEIRQQRFTLFGSNLIDIEGKSIIGLLVDEVRTLPFRFVTDGLADLNIIDHPPVLCFPNRQYNTLVVGRLLLLRLLHSPDLRTQHHIHSCRNESGKHVYLAIPLRF